MNLSVAHREEYKGDWWEWAVWIEGPEAELDEVKEVTYRLHPSFSKPLRTTRDRATKFKLEMEGWKGFPMHIRILLRNGEMFELTHHFALQTMLNFRPAWSLDETERAINHEEANFQHESGRISAARLLSFSVDALETTNVGTFEEEQEAPDRPVVLVADIPAAGEDRERFFLTLGRRGLELICFCDAFIEGKLGEAVVCRAIASGVLPGVTELEGSSRAGDARTISTLISKDALDLLLEVEVVNQPGEWPGSNSGVKLGIGYDLGDVSEDQFRSDWRRHLTEPEMARLEASVGLRGPSAMRVAPTLADIRVTRGAALEVFNRCKLSRMTKLSRSVFPGMQMLPLNAQSALVLLVFSRGPSLQGSRRQEMAEIRRIVQAADLPANLAKVLEQIAIQIESMKRLWDINRLPSLHRQRDAEANLVRKAITSPGCQIDLAKFDS